MDYFSGMRYEDDEHTSTFLYIIILVAMTLDTSNQLSFVSYYWLYPVTIGFVSEYAAPIGIIGVFFPLEHLPSLLPFDWRNQMQGNKMGYQGSEAFGWKL